MSIYYMSVMARTICLIVAIIAYVTADEFNANMENTAVCTMARAVVVRQQDIYNIFAEPPQDGRGTRDRCTVKFIGENGRKIKLFIKEMVFRECMIFVKMYDGDMQLNTARYQFGCNSGATGQLFTSFNSEVAISLEKPDAASTGYKFFLRLATEDGPDISGGAVGKIDDEETGITAGVIAGVVVASVLVIVVVVGVVIYCVIVYRRRKEDKELMARSMSILSPSNASTFKDGGSVHSSKHSTVASNAAFAYPAYRTQRSISEKAPKCNSIDTRSYDSENVNGSEETLPKSILVKNIEGEFKAMKKGLDRQERRNERDKEFLRQQLLSQQQAKRDDRRGREESNRGLGRSNRNKDDRPLLNAENIRRSLRSTRQRGRSFDEVDEDRNHKTSRGAGSVRSTRSTRNRARERDSRSDGDYYSERDYDRGRERSRSNAGRSHRSSSANSTSRRKHDYYDEQDDYSDYDDRRHHRSRDRYDGHERTSRRDSSSRSGTQRSRSQSAGRRHR